MGLAETTKTLSIRASGRCGRKGIALLGRHFHQDPATEVDVTELTTTQIDRLLRHPELIIEQRGATKRSPLPGIGEPKTAAKPKSKSKSKDKGKDKGKGKD